MSRCRWRYEDLPEGVKAQVDALSGRGPAASAAAGVGGSLAAGRKRGARRQPNKTEATYRAEVLGRRGDAVAVRYEGLTLRMENGHRYTPDWVVVTAVGRVECHEVKGGYRLGSYQRARLAFDQVRAEFPDVVWIWAERRTDGSWLLK